jgi:hypothetical protein
MAMSSVPHSSAKPPVTIPPSSTLRGLLDARRAEGRRMSLDEAIAVIVPLCLDLKDRHERGEKLYVHPSAVAPDASGLAKLNPKLALVPTNPRDRHCLAPELQATLEPGDSRASVYSLGAILYEMVTGQHIGPAMKRPRDIEPSLPEALETLIGKAVIGDRQHRPADLGALASAMYHVAPAKSIHPPEISEARIDASAELEVDVKFSMLPPTAQEQSPIPRAPAMPRLDVSSGDPFGNVIERVPAPAPSSRRADDPVTRLAAMKVQLESDPRPRYVVSKDHMDHGPFTAVELLQQIASNTFALDHGLRDEISGQSMPIKEWEEFAPFAEQAALKREVVAEEKAVVRAVAAEKKSGITKTLVGAVIVLALAAGIAFFLTRKKGTRDEDFEIAIDRGSGSVDLDGGIGGKRKRPSGGGGGGGGGIAQGGGGGTSGGGTSFDDIMNNNMQQVNIGGAQTPDLTRQQLAAPLRHAAFLGSCGVPDDMHVTVQVAVKNGRAMGVTVSTNPSSPGVAACVAARVRGLSWPMSDKVDGVTVNY